MIEEQTKNTSENGVYSHLMIHYGELSLKCGNRKWFEEKLIKGLRASLRGYNIASVEKLQGRVDVTLVGLYDMEALKYKVSRVFGVAAYAVAVCAGVSLESIEKTVLAGLAGRQIDTYAVRARRVDKKLPYSSFDANIAIGAAIAKKFPGAKVNLDDPQTTVHIDILKDRSYTYIDKFVGAGGLPTGTAGRVACMISGGIDSPVAAWRMMRRGCVVDFIHFHSAPFTDAASIEKVEEIVEKLNEWQCGAGKIVKVPLGNIQRKIVTATHEKYRVILYRRFMMRLAERIAEGLHAEALVTGEALGQVASQTLSNMNTVASAIKMAPLRPLVGMDKQEIVDLAIKIGTYDVSIIPHQDCCQFLEPRHPVTHTTIEELMKVEESLNIEELVKEGLTQIERNDIEVSS